MFIAEIDFEVLESVGLEQQSDAIYSTLAAYSQDGRILDENFGVFQADKTFKTFVSVPAEDAFENFLESKYISESLQKLNRVGLSLPNHKILGQETEHSESCKCKNSSAYILIANFLSIQSPLNCFECNLPVPLYRFPRPSSGNFYYILGWQSEYKACDTLQMQSGFGERFGILQMSNLKSGLTKSGLNICDEIQNLTEKPCYYYLYHPNGRSLKKERERKCPSCNGDWFLENQLYKLFDFRCDKCHLLSNIAFNLN
jgi:predicted  nucleic acid-binding Zn ribbon protein